MKRLTDQQKSKIALLSKNLSLNKISKQMGISKSVTYYWYRKIVGLKMKPIVVNETLVEELGELIGIFSSDGTFIKEKNYGYKIRIFLAKHEYEYANNVRNLFRKVFSKSGTLFYPHNVNMIFIQIFGKEIINTFQNYIIWTYGKKSYTVRLKKFVNEYNQEFLKGFLRGLFMGDGWATKKNVGFGSISFNLIRNFVQILEIFSIKYYFHTYKKEKRKQFYIITIPVSEKDKFLRTFKINKMLPTGISG